jgi:hypothetical protein
MRAHEFVSEAADYSGSKGMSQQALTTIPNAHVYPELDNSSGYMAYRFGVALAGMPDKKMAKASPTGLKMVTISYTPAEEEILNATAAYFGTPKVQLTPEESSEPDYVNPTSPVPHNSGKQIKRNASK